MATFPRPYDREIPTFWVERTGRVLLSWRAENSNVWQVVGDFLRAEMEVRAKAVWNEHEDCEVVRQEPLFRLPDGSVTTCADLPPGAMFDDENIHGWFTHKDGMNLAVVLPNGHHWTIESRASNCTMPEDSEHRCWIRHGDPRKGEKVTVDKQGLTCQAGAGSIRSGTLEAGNLYHGYLRNGVLTPSEE